MVRLLLATIACAAYLLPAPHVNAHPRFASPASAHYYRHTAYHRQVQLLDEQIRLRKAEIASLERQLEAWQPQTRFRSAGPLMVTIENTRLVLMNLKLDLACLEQDLFDLIHSRGY
jgi:hypothetical protein